MTEEKTNRGRSDEAQDPDRVGGVGAREETVRSEERMVEETTVEPTAPQVEDEDGEEG